MVTVPLLSVGVQLDLPKSKAAAITHPKEPIMLRLNRDDEVFIGDEVTRGDLEGRLGGLAAEDPSRIVYVRADRSVS
jgi:biopolymer transport protein TolR